MNANIALSTDPANPNPATVNGLAKLVEHHGLWVEQLKAMGLTIALAVVGNVVIAFVVRPADSVPRLSGSGRCRPGPLRARGSHATKS